MAQDADWIEGSGGECPVDGQAIVAWRIRDFADNDDHMFRRADRLDWSHGDKPDMGDIIAYRVVRA